MTEELKKEPQTLKKIWNFVATTIGILSGLGLGIMGAVHIAFLFPQFALLLGILALLITCIVLAVTYYSILTNDKASYEDFGAKHLRPWKNRGLVALSACLLLAELPIKFAGIYIGFLVIAPALPFEIPVLALTILAGFFGTAVALTGFFLHSKAFLNLIARFSSSQEKCIVTIVPQPASDRAASAELLPSQNRPRPEPAVLTAEPVSPQLSSLATATISLAVLQ